MIEELLQLQAEYEIPKGSKFKGGKKNSLKKQESSKLSNIEKFKDANGETYTKYMKQLSEAVIDEVVRKGAMRIKIANFLCLYFVLISLFVCIFLFFANNFDSKLVMVVAGGFFVNSVSLILVLLKYVYSSSEELYNHTSAVLNSVDKHFANKIDKNQYYFS